MVESPILAMGVRDTENCSRHLKRTFHEFTAGPPKASAIKRTAALPVFKQPAALVLWDRI